MTTYRCSLDFGVLEMDGIEADSEAEAREKAMKSFRPVLLGIDGSDIRMEVRKSKERPLINVKLDSFKIQEKKAPLGVFLRRVELCKIVARNAEGMLEGVLE